MDCARSQRSAGVQAASVRDHAPPGEPELGVDDVESEPELVGDLGPAPLVLGGQLEYGSRFTLESLDRQRERSPS